jgi:hypothetical protein
MSEEYSSLDSFRSSVEIKQGLSNCVLVNIYFLEYHLNSLDNCLTNNVNYKKDLSITNQLKIHI